jgi:5'(3')-deoxyribonucleotidase
MIYPGRKIVYVDMDHTLCDYAGAYQQYRLSDSDVAYPQSIPGFFSGLAPLPDAIETYRWLHQQELLEVFVLTAPSVMNPLSYTEKRLWVEEHLGLEIAHRLIINPNKGLNKGDYLIDDYSEGKGQEHFEGKLIQFGSNQFPDWQSVREYFQELVPGV